MFFRRQYFINILLYVVSQFYEASKIVSIKKIIAKKQQDDI